MTISSWQRRGLVGAAIALTGFGLAACDDESNSTVAPPVNPNPPVEATIAEVQGAGHVAALLDEMVEVDGIVTAVITDGGAGFYLQSLDADDDTDPATSEGIFVFTDIAPNVSAGDILTVTGEVSEFRQGGDDSANLSTTQISDPMITVQSSGNELPEATVIGAGGLSIPSDFVQSAGDVEDEARTFDPTASSIDFFESVEGMLVQVSSSVAVSPKDRFDQLFVMTDADYANAPQTLRGGVFISEDNFNPQRIQLDGGIDDSFLPDANVGASVDAATGVVGYSFSNYEVILTELATADNPLPAADTTQLTGTDTQLTIATYNVLNLDPGDNTFDAIAGHIVTNLAAPDIIALQEVQDNDGRTDSGETDADQTFGALIAAITGAGGPTYEFRQINPGNREDGGQPGGNIRVGFLFNPDRVSFEDRAPGDGGSTTVEVIPRINDAAPVLSVNPGRVDPASFPDSRKPLAGEFQFNGEAVFVVANHFNSKGGDDPLYGRFQPPVLNSEAERLTQAEAVNEFVDDILALDADANVIVLGDLNDFEFSDPIATVAGDALTNLIDSVPTNDRYTFNFQGNSQVLDHILVSGSLATGAEVDIVHVNVDSAEVISDHEPVVARVSVN
ncbi:MAG: endonuclease/exonuclease/phosphatase family protein [Cyanobacteria bacterium J06639_1]